MTDYKSIAQHVLDCAKKYGAQNASAEISKKQRLEICWRKGQIEDIKSAGDSVLYIQLFVDGRYGYFYSSDLRQDRLDEYIHNAIDMARLLEEDSARTLPDPALYENRANVDLELFDPEVAQLTPNQVIEMCGTLEAECQKYTDIPIFDILTRYRTSFGELYKVNTNGFEGMNRWTSASNYCSITIKDGDKNTSGEGEHSARFWSDLHQPDVLAAEAAQDCRYRMGATKIASGHRTIILDQRRSRFLQRFLNPLNGYNFVEKQSYFLDKIGQMVGSPLLDLHNKPFIKRGMNSCLFDSEGISTTEAIIMDHGKLIYCPMDTYCANKLNMKSTPELSNVVLTPGKRSCKEMITDVKDGIYVFDLIGGNTDETQGDFSFGIFGVAIENGKLTKNVSEMNISGNFLELWKNLMEVGNDPRDDSIYVMPTLRFDNVSTSGS